MATSGSDGSRLDLRQVTMDSDTKALLRQALESGREDRVRRIMQLEHEAASDKARNLCVALLMVLALVAIAGAALIAIASPFVR